MDMYLLPLVEELLDLYEGRITLLDGRKIQTGALIYCTADSRAVPDLNKGAQCPAHVGACPECDVVGQTYRKVTLTTTCHKLHLEACCTYIISNTNPNPNILPVREERRKSDISTRLRRSPSK